MISKVSALKMQTAKSSVSHHANSVKNTNSDYENNTQVVSQNGAKAIKNSSNITFCARTPLTPLEKSIIGESEIRIPNLLELEEDIHLSFRKMPENKIEFNTKGVNLVRSEEGDKKVITISNDSGQRIFVGKFDKDKDISELPELIYKQGKYMPEITVKDESLEGKRIKMLAGSEIIGDGFELKMGGSYRPAPDKEAQQISFTGHTYITTLHKEPSTVNAFNLYYNSDLAAHAIKGDYADEMKEFDPNVALAMGGEGTRFGNIARSENKPAAKLPTNDNYRIMASTLNLEAAAGLLGDKDNDEITYISQKDEIHGDNVYLSGKYKTDGGAIAEGLARGIIRNDKDIVILNGDIFTNADITRAYHALKTLPNAALVIPYYPVNDERAKSFGLLGVEEDSSGNMQVISFIEKPKYTTMPIPAQLAHGEYKDALEEFKKVQLAHHPSQDGVYLANPGMYFLSNEASKVLMAQGIIDPDRTGLGKHVMPKIVELANQCKLKDKDGNELKVYTVPLEAKGGKPAVWEDIGTAEAYLRTIKDVAHQTTIHGTTSENKYYGMPEFLLRDFKKNSDLETGIVYGSNNSHWTFELFKEKYHVTSARGNIFLTVD